MLVNLILVIFWLLLLLAFLSTITNVNNISFLNDYIMTAKRCIVLFTKWTSSKLISQFSFLTIHFHVSPQLHL